MTAKVRGISVTQKASAGTDSLLDRKRGCLPAYRKMIRIHTPHTYINIHMTIKNKFRTTY